MSAFRIKLRLTGLIAFGPKRTLDGCFNLPQGSQERGNFDCSLETIGCTSRRGYVLIGPAHFLLPAFNHADRKFMRWDTRPPAGFWPHIKQGLISTK
jgi:hypothetical protein